MEKTRRSGIRLSRPQRRIISTTAGPVVTDARKRGEERRPKNYGRTGASPYIQMNKAACARARPFSLLREKRDPERSVLSIPRLSLRIQHARRHSSKKRTRPGSAREARTGTCCDRHHSPDAFLDIAASTIQLGRFPAHLLKYTVLNEPHTRPKPSMHSKCSPFPGKNKRQFVFFCAFYAVSARFRSFQCPTFAFCAALSFFALGA